MGIRACELERALPKVHGRLGIKVLSSQKPATSDMMEPLQVVFKSKGMHLNAFVCALATVQWPDHAIAVTVAALSFCKVWLLTFKHGIRMATIWLKP